MNAFFCLFLEMEKPPSRWEMLRSPSSRGRSPHPAPSNGAQRSPNRPIAAGQEEHSYFIFRWLGEAEFRETAGGGLWGLLFPEQLFRI